jgi:hypothetical protein
MATALCINLNHDRSKHACMVRTSTITCATKYRAFTAAAECAPLSLSTLLSKKPLDPT